MSKDQLSTVFVWEERQDAKQMYGGIRIDQAIDSLAAIIDRDPQQLRGLIE